MVAGNLLSVPLLSQTADVYGVGRLLVPGWVDLAVPAAMCCLVGLAALLPAWRAGRLSAVQAIAAGRAPRPNRGYAAHRLLGRLALPRPVTIGLAAPFARPARTAVTIAAILFGATAVIFATGLASSLDQAAAGQSHVRTQQVQVVLPGGDAPAGSGRGAGAGQRLTPDGQDRAVAAAVAALPGTARYVAEAMPRVGIIGLAQQAPAEVFRGDAAWAGYDMISGRWFRGPGEIDVNTALLSQTGRSVGDSLVISFGGRLITVRIAGQVFDPLGRDQPAVLTSWPTLGGARAGLTVQQYDVELRPGTNARGYQAALSQHLGSSFEVLVPANDPFYNTLIALISTLTLLLAVVAGLGVLNTVALSTRERVHELGVFKAVGMTPRQLVEMVMCWVAGAGLAAGMLAIPAGIALHSGILRVMASAAGTGLPGSYVSVFRAPELLVLALSGLVIAIAGALLPACWAARAKTASALHAE